MSHLREGMYVNVFWLTDRQVAELVEKFVQAGAIPLETTEEYDQYNNPYLKWQGEGVWCSAFPGREEVTVDYVMDDGETMTPCQKKGYKVGDKFILLESDDYNPLGTVVELISDDGTEVPLFCREGDPSIEFYINIECLKPLTKVEIDDKINITLSMDELLMASLVTGLCYCKRSLGRNIYSVAKSIFKHRNFQKASVLTLTKLKTIDYTYIQEEVENMVLPNIDKEKERIEGEIEVLEKQLKALKDKLNVLQ